MRAEGSQTKAHPVLKKLVTKKELVDFYDTTELDFKVQLRALAKGYINRSGVKKFELEGQEVSEVLDQKIQQIQGKSKANSAKNDKKKAKKAAAKAKTGTNRLVVVEQENLLNLDGDEDMGGFEEVADVIDSEEELRLNNGDGMGMAEEGLDGEGGFGEGDSDDSEDIDFDKIQGKMKTAEAPGKSNAKPVIQDKLGAQMYYDS